MAEPEPQVLEPVAPIQGNLNLAHEVSEHESLYNAVWEGNYGTTEQIITTNSRAAKARITFSRRTALHVAAMAGHMSIVELLVQNLSPEDLEITDNDGFTALAVAIISNAPQIIAECMVLKNTRILTIKCYNMLPVAMAFHYGHKELGRYLYSVWGGYHKDYLSQNPQDGATIICNAIYMESFSMSFINEFFFSLLRSFYFCYKKKKMAFTY
nr:uncharacterized protein LOC112488824 [Ziziphus jujuba var. spinosa]